MFGVMISVQYRDVASRLAHVTHINNIRAAFYPMMAAKVRHQGGITALKWMIKVGFAASVSTVNYLVYYFSCGGK